MVCVDVWPAVTDAKEASDMPFDPLEERACPNCGEFGVCIVPEPFLSVSDPSDEMLACHRCSDDCEKCGFLTKKTNIEIVQGERWCKECIKSHDEWGL